MKKLIKKITAILLLSAVIMTGMNVQEVKAAPAGEIHGVWVSYLDWQSNLKGKSEADFSASFAAMCDRIVANGGNTVIVHVRSHNDAVYPSTVYPWSDTMLNGNPGYDPLAIMVNTAHAKGLSFHAWINPYGYRNGAFAGNAALATQANIVAGVAEICQNYAVDGIHFDDYFPPLGAPALNAMMAAVHQTAAAYGKQFGVAPQGNIENNIAMGADVATWLSTPGYIDYIAPQIYWTDNYGAAGTTQMFSNRLAQWNGLNKAGIPMYVGMALYRTGVPMGADPGWSLKNNNLQTQANLAASYGWKGYVLYSYASLGNATSQAELANLRAR